jgi:hypothetical protein
MRWYFTIIVAEIKDFQLCTITTTKILILNYMQLFDPQQKVYTGEIRSSI